MSHDGGARPVEPHRVSVLVPTFDRAAFIGRALESLLAQTLEDWELVVVDDGSTDATASVVEPYLNGGRARYRRLEHNVGLGAALNVGLSLSTAPLVAYLPSDDVYHPAHLELLVGCLEAERSAALAFSGVRNEVRVVGKGVLETRTSVGQMPGWPLQLVQVAHRRTDDRWLERHELVTDDLDRMYWDALRRHGPFVGSGRITCDWVDHPDQRHKTVREPEGGINVYRSRYRVQEPLRFHSSVGNRLDEVEHYRRFRERPSTPVANDGLRVLLVGELAYNPERVLALEERGHRLYGLWTPDPQWFNTVGPLPFGHVEDLPRDDWARAARAIRPDVIYALLNWAAVPFAHHVLNENPGVPFVWHFKEGPFDCIANGTWPMLVDLVTRSDGQVYSSPEMRDWFVSALSERAAEGPSLVLDGDLAKADWFAGQERSPLLSEADGEVHTVVPGAPVGISPSLVAALAGSGVHLHFYGDFHRGRWGPWVEEVQQLAPGHLHLHPQVSQERWVPELSQYDAGWLHLHPSDNGGDLRRATWEDLNYPARMATLALSGVPFIEYENPGAVVATRTLARGRRLGLGLALGREGGEGLVTQLRDADLMASLRESVWAQRSVFTFDQHADELVRFLRRVIALK